MAFHEGTVPELLCESTQAYSDACVEKGVPQPSWRTDSFCPMQCPAMSEYTQCVSPCPATCADLQAAEKCSPAEPCAEGCRCLVGFVLSGDVCVPADACGCFTEGRYHSLNEEWSEGDQLCWCGQSRDIRCVQMSNAPEETTFVNGTSEEAPPADKRWIVYSDTDKTIHKSKYFISDTFPYVVQLNQPLYVQVQVLTPDQDLQLFAENCMATPSANILDPMSYTFISDGCPVDSTFLSLFSSSQKQERFSINSFAFVEDYPEVYLHCTVMVCNSTDPTSRCAQGCLPPPVRHRRADLGAEPRYNVYKGPILNPGYKRPSDMDVAEEVEDNRGARVPPGVVTSLVIAVGLLLCAVVTLVGVIAYMRMRTVRKELYMALPTDDLE
ncbi:zonadhesin-like [Branchiostoma floridae]|uniref:Zonadhesin-like n=1 Tax=Branchiostoma floridae TaxID=7739 RepID=A0A9J7HWH5_BRAFL|nr:zonadhesin-like [Branchiostoma floridae]